MKSMTAVWVRKAERDFVAAQQLARGEIPLHDQVCFFCQQSAEKYLKALLQEFGLPITRTHNLEHLLNQLKSHCAGIRSIGRGAVFLTRFAVETRYPGDQATRR